jgi:hypothetical protein
MEEMEINNEIKEVLNKVRVDKGFSPTDDPDELSEILTEDGEEVWRGDYYQHRWFHKCTVVTKFGDKFIAYREYEVQGDNSAMDFLMDYEPPIYSASFVTPKTKTITVYK